MVLAFVAAGEPKYALLCSEDGYSTSAAPPRFPGSEWIMLDDPSRLGWDEEKLDQAFDAARGLGLAAVFVVDDGMLVAASGCTKQEWYVASVRKSLMNAVIGKHIENGLLSLETTLSELGIDDIDPPLTDAQRQTTLRQLLTSSSGICRPAAAGSNCTPERADEREEPFIYNNWDFNALLSVHRAVSDEDFFEFFNREVAIPIGLDGFDPIEDGRYERIEASLHPAFVIDMSAEDLARVGVLYLNDGLWDGTPILSAEWIEASTEPRVKTASPVGASAYGYLWWVQTADGMARFGLPEGTYSAEGNWAQAVIVIPEERLVVVVRGHIPRLFLFGKPEAEEIKAFFRMLLSAKGSAAG